MFATPEQLAAAQKSNIDALFSLSNQAFNSMEKLFALNINTARAAIETSANNCQKFLSVKDPQEFLSVSVACAQPATEKITNYTRELNNIVTDNRANFVKAVESSIENNNEKMRSIFAQTTQHAPIGSETAIAIFKSAFDASTTAYENFAKSTKQAMQAVESNMSNVADNISQAAINASNNATARNASQNNAQQNNNTQQNTGNAAANQNQTANNISSKKDNR